MLNKHLENFTDKELQTELTNRKKLSNQYLYFSNDASGVLCEKMSNGSYWVLNGEWELKPTKKKNEYWIMSPPSMGKRKKVVVHFEKIKRNKVKEKLGEGYDQYVPHNIETTYDENGIPF